MALAVTVSLLTQLKWKTLNLKGIVQATPGIIAQFFSHTWQKYAYFYSTHALQCPAVKVYRTCAEAGLLNLNVYKLHTIKDLELKTSDK